MCQYNSKIEEYIANIETSFQNLKEVENLLIREKCGPILQQIKEIIKLRNKKFLLFQNNFF